MANFGESLLLATEQMKTRFDSRSIQEVETRKQEQEGLHDKIDKLERLLAAETHGKRLAEAQITLGKIVAYIPAMTNNIFLAWYIIICLLLEKREAELRLRDAMTEVYTIPNNEFDIHKLTNSIIYICLFIHLFGIFYCDDRFKK